MEKEDINLRSRSGASKKWFNTYIQIQNIILLCIYCDIKATTQSVVS